MNPVAAPPGEASALPLVLCVDDEPQVLAGLARVLHGEFDVVTATSGAAGLAIVEERRPAVIVSDMRMPGMDGATFLARAKAKLPDASRVLLTGHADLNDAMRAVNEGGLTQFLIKPCPADQIERTVRSAAEVARLRAAERTLLTNTVNGVIRLLVEVLALTSPEAYRVAGLANHIALHIEKKLGRTPSWEVEAASLLCTLGYITLPHEALGRALHGGDLSAVEQGLFAGHAAAAARLLRSIPRLETVADLVARQDQRGDARPADDVAIDAAVVRVAVLAANAILEGHQRAELDTVLRARLGGFDATLTGFLADVVLPGGGGVERWLTLDGLRRGMHVVDPILARSGALLVAGGQEVTPVLLERLHRFAASTGVAEPIRVLIAG